YSSHCNSVTYTRLGCAPSVHHIGPQLANTDWQRIPMQRATKSGFAYIAFIFNFCVVPLFLGILLTTGCSLDPQSVAQKSFAQAERAASENKLDEAALLYRKAIQNNPKLFAAHLNLAKLYLDRKNYANSFHELQTALKLNPENREARGTLAKLYLVTG